MSGTVWNTKAKVQSFILCDFFCVFESERVWSADWSLGLYKHVLVAVIISLDELNLNRS